MAVDVSVGGAPEWNASRVSVTEDSTPLDPSDTFGGVGAITFRMPATKDILNKPVTLDDSNRGALQGIVKALSGDRNNVDVAALTLLSQLVCDRTAQPHVGTLESLVLYYFELCGITSGVVVAAEIADIAVVVPGWYGSVWEQLKNLTAAYQVEVAAIGDEIHVRLPRSVTAERVRESAFSWSLDDSRLAQTVDGWYYVPTQITDALVVGNREISPQSNIDAGEVIEFDVPLSASLSSVVQPVPSDSVAFSESGSSTYSVLDKDDNPVPASAWLAGGGSVTVEIGEDTRSVHVTVVGSQNRFLAPYRLAGVAVSGAEYSTLRILGTGVAFERRKYTLPASSRAAVEVGAEFDNVFLPSWGHAHLVMLHTARRHGGVSRRISGSAWHVFPGGSFAGQTFGNVAGSRVFEDNAVYRIRSVSYSPVGVGYEAEVDTTFADTNAVNAGLSIAEWNAAWSGRPIREYNLRPLTPIANEVEPEPAGYGSGVYGGLPVYGG